MRLPDFLFIGPDKTGSTWLFEYLRSHPQCFIPAAKDIYFFDREYDRGLEWYAGFFAPAGTERRAGEICHDYILARQTAERIKDAVPDVRLISSLRDPVARAVSHYQYLVRSGMASGTFEDALRHFPELLENSRYRTLLEPYVEIFGREKLLLLIYEDLRDSPSSFAQQVCDHLQIEHLEPEIGVVRPASRARSATLAKSLKAGAHLARRLGLQNLVGHVKHSKISDLAFVELSSAERPTISSNIKKRLSEEFSADAEWVRGHVGRSLDEWSS